MKKTLIVSIFTLLAFAGVARAQVQFNACSVVDGVTYNTCCSGAAYYQNQYRCNAYQADHNTSVPGTIQSGTPGTQPVNSNVVFQTGNPTASTTSSGSSAASLAQCSAVSFKSLLDILIWIKCIIAVGIIPLIFAAAFVFFLWGVMKFIMSSDSTKKEEGKKFIVAGLIGLFVMTSLWGIIKIVGNTLGVDSSVPLLQTEYLKK